MCYVYILSGKRYYTGSTINIDRRLKDHKNHNTPTTKKIGDWKLVFLVKCSSLKEARKLELKIKKSGHPERWINGISNQIKSYKSGLAV